MNALDFAGGRTSIIGTKNGEILEINRHGKLKVLVQVHCFVYYEEKKTKKEEKKKVKTKKEEKKRKKKKRRRGRRR